VGRAALSHGLQTERQIFKIKFTWYSEKEVCTVKSV
jgi:hypothetical protein